MFSSRFLSASLLLIPIPTISAEWVLESVIRGTAGNPDIFGLVQIVEAANGTVTVDASVTGLPDGSHGFHIHQYGDIVGATDGTAAGGHFNPLGVDHAGPDDATRHVGDLGNIESVDGVASYYKTFEATDDARPTVVSSMPASVVGRSFIIHADPDDLESQPTGNAGSRLAAGVIGIANDQGETDPVVEHIESEDFEDPPALVCAIVGDDNVVIGSAMIVLNDEGVASVTASVSSLTPGAHGFHVHQYGNEYEFGVASEVERDLGLTAGHYNPTGVMHGLPPTTPRHYGDIGNLEVNDDGNVLLENAPLPGVTNLRHLIGRTCLVHAGEDDGSDPAGKNRCRWFISSFDCGILKSTHTVNQHFSMQETLVIVLLLDNWDMPTLTRKLPRVEMKQKRPKMKVIRLPLV